MGGASHCRSYFFEASHEWSAAAAAAAAADLSSLLRHVERHHGAQSVVSRRVEGDSPLVMDHAGQAWFPTGDVASIDPHLLSKD